MSRLSKEEVVVLKKLKKKNEDKASKSALARLFHVRERTVRYHLKREKEGTADKRKNKPMKADPLAHILDDLMRGFDRIPKV